MFAPSPFVLDYNLFDAFAPITEDQQYMCVSGAHAFAVVPSRAYLMDEFYYECCTKEWLHPQTPYTSLLPNERLTQISAWIAIFLLTWITLQNKKKTIFQKNRDSGSRFWWVSG